MPSKPRPLLISCGIMQKEIEKLLEEKRLDVDVVFLDAGLHVIYAELEKALTSALEKHADNAPNGIIVVYGDMCHHGIKRIIKKYSNTIKVNALNCIDCLLGGHQKLLEIDPDGSHFYLSPGWMPSNLKKNKHFREIFDWDIEDIKEQFEHLSGVIIIDSLDNLDELQEDITEFCENSGLQVKTTKTVGLDGLKAVIDEAAKKLQNQKQS
ncbi:MAG: hypothetical protein CW716_06575 [Candidatus Bathyarchaeum sp.]|nr:MAG: hypothetical protein CW716_06575 [Candidatus Bathyarchaeum sp.]